MRKLSSTRALFTALLCLCNTNWCLGQEIGDIVKKEVLGELESVGVYCGVDKGKAVVINFQDDFITGSEVEGFKQKNYIPSHALMHQVKDALKELNINGFTPFANETYLCLDGSSQPVSYDIAQNTIGHLNLNPYELYRVRMISLFNRDYLHSHASLSTLQGYAFILLDDDDINSISTLDSEPEINTIEGDFYQNNITNADVYYHELLISNSSEHPYNHLIDEIYESSNYYDTDEVCLDYPTIPITNNHNTHHRILNMYDAYGDGWNGATYQIIDASGASIAFGGLSSGHQGTNNLFMADGCYTMIVEGGNYPEEISWSIQLNESSNEVLMIEGGVGTEYFSVGEPDCDMNVTELPACASGEVMDCDGSQECFPQNWIGDGFCDGADQKYDADLSCHNNDGDDCGTVDCHGMDYAGYEDWIGDGYCDDGTWGFYFNCPKFNDDEGDCIEGLRLASKGPKSFIKAKLNSETVMITLTDEGKYKEGDPLDYDLYNILGNIVSKGALKGVENKLPLDHLIPGAYILKVKNSAREEILNYKFVNPD